MPDDTPKHRYDAHLANTIEPRWQEAWDKAQVFRAPNPGEPGFDPSKPKFYCLDMFPYPSGAGLHVGHPEGYTATDILCRYKRMRGFNVLHPMGYDAFGLPAEQYAIQTGVHPAVTTRQSIENFRRQLKRFGFCYDWSREIATIDPEYYKWTQWIFLRLYDAWIDPRAPGGGRARPIHELDFEMAIERGPATLPSGTPWTLASAAERRAFTDSYRLAYLAESTVNWCPALGTVLANDEVIDGRSERGGHPVVRKPLRQWMFRITALAERLLNDLDLIDWPSSTRTMQTEWIGRSEGAEIEFEVVGNSPLRIFTTRPDTIFGATYMVVAPEHPLVESALESPSPRTDASRLRAYADAARRRSDVDRQADTKTKTGVDTGLDAVNPATGALIPIWTADYVLMGYGTGAIMAVPAHDQRDFDFARAFGLPIKQVLALPDGVAWDGAEAFTADSVAINSASTALSIDGLKTPDAKAAVIGWLERTARGTRRINYRLRDWAFSRQRYWGEPFPIVYDEQGNHYSVGPAALPVVLPELADYSPVESDEPKPLLAKATEWVHTTAGAAGVDPALLPPETLVKRETNTMPGSAGSSWYYLRYCDAKNSDRFISREAEKYWMTSRKSGQRPNPELPRGTGVPPVSSVGPATGPTLEKSRRNLPHWEKGGSSYLVTFRCQSGVLRDSERRIVLDACTHWHGERATVHLAVVMPDHVHLLLTPLPKSEGAWYSLSELTHSIKSFSSHEIGKLRGRGGTVWQDESYDRLVRDADEFDQMWNYGLMNPVSAKLCHRPWEYEFMRSPTFEQAYGGKPSPGYGEPVIPGSAASRPAGEHRRDACATGSGDVLAQAAWNPATHHAGGIDLYMGGSEHAVGHLLYARFWHKVLFDLGEVSTPEPFGRLFHQGMITAFAYQRPDKTLCPNDQVDEVSEGKFVERGVGTALAPIVAKMSKSLKNVVNPDDVIAEYGADTFRLYEMYMGPLEASKPWNPRDIIGMHRFLQKLWRLVVDEDTGATRLAEAPDTGVEKRLHRAQAKAESAVESLSFNTAIASLIEFVNSVQPGGLARPQLDRLARVLSVFAPHIAEELWLRAGAGVETARGFVCAQPWPDVDPKMLVDDEVEVPVQVNGKLRGRVMVPAKADPKAAEAIALADAKVIAALEGKPVKKAIVVPGKMINLIV